MRPKWTLNLKKININSNKQEKKPKFQYHVCLKTSQITQLCLKKNIIQFLAIGIICRRRSEQKLYVPCKHGLYRRK
jgi:hypothetical protein